MAVTLPAGDSALTVMVPAPLAVSASTLNVAIPALLLSAVPLAGEISPAEAVAVTTTPETAAPFLPFFVTVTCSVAGEADVTSLVGAPFASSSTAAR